MISKTDFIGSFMAKSERTSEFGMHRRCTQQPCQASIVLLFYIYQRYLQKSVRAALREEVMLEVRRAQVFQVFQLRVCQLLQRPLSASLFEETSSTQMIKFSVIEFLKANGLQLHKSLSSGGFSVEMFQRTEPNSTTPSRHSREVRSQMTDYQQLDDQGSRRMF